MGTERPDAHTLSTAVEFYGLAHIVHVWRAIDPEQRRVGAGLGPELQRILERADRYMRWADTQFPVNEVAEPATITAEEAMEPKEVQQ